MVLLFALMTNPTLFDDVDYYKLKTLFERRKKKTLVSVFYLVGGLCWSFHFEFFCVNIPHGNFFS